MMKNGGEKLRRKLRGWLKVSRERHLVAQKYHLSDGEFRLLELYRDLTDWDARHEDTFQTFYATDSDVAQLCNCSQSTVCRRRSQLVAKALIKKLECGRFRVIDCLEEDKYSEALEIFGKDPTADKPDAQKKFQLSLKHNDIAPVQAYRGYNEQTSLVSFKGDLVSEKPCSRYLDLERTGRFGTMTADDMEFIEPSNQKWELIRNRILNDGR